MERGEALSIALHLVLEFDGGGVYGSEGDEGDGGEGERALPPPIRISGASSRWLATLSAYPLSGAEVGDVVREAVGLVGGGGRGGSGSGSDDGGERERDDGGKEEESSSEKKKKKKSDLARSLALAGASLPRRPGASLSL